MRVLIADDNRDAADTLAELLAMDLGCSVVTAYDGRSALQRALDERPDVLILDVRMPELGGVDVVRELRRVGSIDGAAQGPPLPPLLLAVTGNDVSGVLPDVDGSFDGAFAKPVDVQALESLLRRHWQRETEPLRHGPLELSDLLCQVARRSAPMLRARGHVPCFDYRGPALLVEIDEAAMHSGLHRLLCGVVDMVEGGFTVLKASVQPEPSGAWTLIVHIAAAGAALAPSEVGEVLARLDLVDVLGGSPAGAPARTAIGTCPRSGAHVQCVVAPSDGVLFRFETRVQPLQVVDVRADAQGARAWIIDPALVPSALLQRRLQRLGWRVRRFDSFAPALERAAQLTPESTPELVIVMEASDGEGDAWVDLQAVLPTGVQYLRVVAIGSALLRKQDDPLACSVRVDPVSPRELVELTHQLRRAGEMVDEPADEGPLTAAAGLQDRPRLLVVDDVEVNRIVASGLASALGYEVTVVADGLDAIQHCKQAAPDVVLMDINMSVLGGIDATEHIRHLQRLGKVPPFPIVAATANDDPQTRDRCRRVGMDGFVSKPLALQALREELRRVTLNAPH